MYKLPPDVLVIVYEYDEYYVSHSQQTDFLNLFMKLVRRDTSAASWQLSSLD